MKKLLWIGLAGAAGALARMAIGQLVAMNRDFPLRHLP